MTFLQMHVIATRGTSSSTMIYFAFLVQVCAVLLFLPRSAHATRHHRFNGGAVPVALVPPPPSTSNGYPAARSIRVNEGHGAAVEPYHLLLLENPDDTTAATRIAASPFAPERHDLACPVGDTDDKIASLKALLDDSGYNRINIGKLFGVMQGNGSADLYPFGPTYLTPVEAGSLKRKPPLPISAKSQSLSCLVSMFLLGFALDRAELEEHIVGGSASIELLENLGLAFPCEVDPSLVVPYCHLFPMDVPQVKGVGVESIVLATDLHPVALSRTTAGTQEEGAVMYIGPDSLALVQHLPLAQQVDNPEWKGARRDHLILDLCTGSGIQAIATLAALGQFDATAKAICVDINERALRFTKFNSILNGMGDRIDIVKGDISDQKALPMKSPISNHTYTSGSLVQALRCLAGDGISKDSFDIILSNPPFIPVPPIHPTTGESLAESTWKSIDLRYGLFSSGGADGESILANILTMAPKLVNGCGFVGIVSEFMNPSKSLCWKLEQWWAEGCENDCADPPDTHTGVLFTNEEPIEASIYARRRANDDDECNIWLSHLNDQHIRSISPGLLYIRGQQLPSLTVGSGPSDSVGDNGRRSLQRSSACPASLQLEHILVPKSAKGSIWTPQNLDAVNFTRKRWLEHCTDQHPQVNVYR